ncbi:ATP-dependent DNA helicase [Campylobacter sp. MG1]|uniref:ATP-dependent DNA helicase n=1 Tax=Campylobacter sp. MG1 TaxID=2976332 RepID=UPI00226D15F6|nr:AAA family ATPase [Campylobacter sp. MG1]
MNNTKYILDILKHNNVFLTGGAGVGKSYTIEKIIESQQFKSVVLASTALAAINIGGDTVHRFFKFRLAKNINELRTSKDDLYNLHKVLSSINLIIIDEISMISAELFEMIALRLLGYSHIKLLLVGDFYQLEPVNANGSYAFTTPAWEKFNFKVLELKVQHRLDDNEFYRHLKNIRLGNITNDCIKYFRNFITNDSINNYDDYTIICGTNAEAKNINIEKLRAIDYPKIIYERKIKFNKDLNKEEENDLNIWLKSLPIEDEFIFKKSAKVIFTHNAENYYNGMQGEIIDYNLEEQELRIKSNSFIYNIKPKEFYYFSNPQIAAIYRVNPSEVTQNPDVVVTAFPLKLSYAITIHKSQGMGIEKLVCKCDKIFAQGQLYVALSRSANPDKFKIIFDGNERQFTNLFYQKASTNNIVNTFYDNCNKEVIE